MATMSLEVQSAIPSLATEKIRFIDPSEHFRPEGKKEEEFRVYSMEAEDRISKRVREMYLKMHTYQTVDFVKKQRDSWCKFDKCKLTVMEALDKLEVLIDESDPDVDIPNIVHAFQTAERIRQYHPDKDWFQFAGLIHDLGKMLAIMGEPHWAMTGDTYPVGCEFQPSIVFRETSFHNNPDIRNDAYTSKYGIYEKGIGMDNLLLAWGHDEYMYQVCKNHPGCAIPDEGLYCIRFHSFYPYHTGKDYQYLMSERDRQMLPWLHEFNRFDLYTKSDSVPDIDALKPYYQSLCDKFLPGKLAW